MAIYKRKVARKVSRKPRRVRRVPPKNTFAKKVLAVVRREAETKQAYQASSDSILTFPASTVTGQGLNIFSPLPGINRGSNEAERIGNTISPISLNVKGYLFMKPTGVSGSYNATQSRICVRMMVIQPKQFNSNTNASSTVWYTQLLQKGNNTVAFTGKITDLFAPINRDVFKVWHDKKFYMTATQVAQVTATGYYTIENKDATKFFNFNIKLPKKLTYDDSNSSGTMPINCAPQILVGWSYMDGSAPGTLQDVGIQYDSVMKYDDC